MRKNLLAVFPILLGSFLYMLGTCLFIFPHGLLLGGTSGISVILTNVLPFSPGTILTGINVLLLILAAVILGRGMAVRTFIGSAATTVFIGVFDALFPGIAPPVENVFLSAVIGAAVIALASGILFYVDASSGGTDIIALIIRKYRDVQIGRALLITDVLIVIVGGIFSGAAVAVSSFVGLLIKTLGIDGVIAGVKKAAARRERRG